MAPKTTIPESTEAKNITVLCHLIMSSDEFKADTAKLTNVLGISHAKNVIIGPRGFELKGGKVIKKDGVLENGAQTRSAVSAPTPADAGNGKDKSDKDPTPTLTKKKAKANTKAKVNGKSKKANKAIKGGAIKKRKLVESEDDDNDEPSA